MKNVLALIFSLIIVSSCTTAQVATSVSDNDSDMEFGSYDEQQLEENIYTYREGASGGTAGKSGGGCGCN